ncbi:hypothetical protein EPN28_01795 [Patescibacteria group bacterium]|nr:MAG: hypothetical protein EPN28_01795 [Patescibacteria group bacterium]
MKTDKKAIDLHLRLKQNEAEELTHSGEKPLTQGVYDAVRVYRWMLKRKREGWRVGAISPDGGQIEVPFLDEVP